MCANNDIIYESVPTDETADDKKKRLDRERYRTYYLANLEKVRKAALDRYYRVRDSKGSQLRPVGRPRKYEDA
jgi:hypothetical protein